MGQTPGEVVKLGPLRFLPGVTGWNVSAVMYAAFMNVVLMSYIGFIQPFILTDILHIPADQQGAITGNLVLLQEIIILSFMSFSGAISDRLGRRIVFVTGFAVLGLGYVCYPLAGDVTQLYGARAIFALGVAIAPIMVTATVVDVISEESRGRWVGVISIMSALGGVFMALALSRLPNVFLGQGEDPATAGRYAHWVAAGISLFTAAFLWLGIRGPVLSGARRVVRERVTALAGVIGGMKATVANPRLGLAMCGGFIGRGDFAVIGAFFSLWIVQTGKAAGMDTGEALAYAGRLFSVVQLSAMLWGGCMGFISDRMDRLSALGLAALLSALGYLSLSLVDDPFSRGMLGVAVLAGIGEVSVVVAASALLGQQAPAQQRGAAAGLYGVLGALGIGTVSFLGGQLFDRVSWHGPFLLMVGLNLLLLVAAVLVRIGNRQTGLAAAAPGSESA